MSEIKTIRLLLGDQLNHQHSWFQEQRKEVLYLMMEIRSETDYATHHIQKLLGFFAAMRNFAARLEQEGHQVRYIRLDEPGNTHSFAGNLRAVFSQHPGLQEWQYQLPDEYRVDQHLKEFASSIQNEIPCRTFDSEHFFTERNSLHKMFGAKVPRMEFFYRQLRRQYKILMDGNEPLTGQWNYDADNRKKIPPAQGIPEPLVFANDLRELEKMLLDAGVSHCGQVDAHKFSWPVSREQSEQLLIFFVQHCLPLFGTYEDAMSRRGWSLFHSRLSFSMNLKMLHPAEVLEAAIRAWQERPEEISFNQLEGFVRQILGWREFVRALYWREMPSYAGKNFLNHQRPLPAWFWTGETRMNCLKHAIGQTMEHAYAHHIQRLMLIGNFSLLAGLHPDEVDHWYLSVYIDALEWVEMPNTRGMSQFADGGLIASKPYVSSAAYIDKMSDYCSGCYYAAKEKTTENACPFNSLYWHFYHRNETKLKGNPRIGMAYQVWAKMTTEAKAAILEKAEEQLQNIENL